MNTSHSFLVAVTSVSTPHDSWRLKIPVLVNGWSYPVLTDSFNFYSSYDGQSMDKLHKVQIQIYSD